MLTQSLPVAALTSPFRLTHTGHNIRNTALVNLPDEVFGESTGRQGSTSSSGVPRRAKKAGPSLAFDEYVATMAETGKKRAKVLAMTANAKLEADAEAARDRAEEEEVKYTRQLRTSLKTKHPLKPDDEIKSRARSLIKRASAKQDGLSLSQATDCSTDTVSTFSTIGLAANAAAKHSKRRMKLDVRLQSFEKKLDGKGYESDATERTTTTKRRRAVSTDTDSDSDAST